MIQTLFENGVRMFFNFFRFLIKLFFAFYFAKSIVEYCDDNLEIIASFAEEGLNLSSSNVYLAFIKYYYENVLHKSFARREKDCPLHFANLSSVLLKT